MAVCLIGLSGLPPTGGFLAKLNLFLAAWSEGTTDGRILAITLAVNAVIAATYYLRLISVMYFEQSTVVLETSRQPAAWIAGCLCAHRDAGAVPDATTALECCGPRAESFMTSIHH